MARRHRVLAAVVILVLGVVTLVAPVAAATTPTDTLRTFFGQINRVLADAGSADDPTESLTAVRKLLAALVDYRGAAELALGREWHARTDAEHAEFVSLFTDLLERAYVLRVAATASLSGGVGVHYLGESIEGDLAIVQTTMVRRSGDEMTLDYRMARHGGRWLVQDVTIEGVSVAENYQAQFHRLIRLSSYPDLVAHMKAKSGPLRPDEPGPGPIEERPAIHEEPAPPREADRAREPDRAERAAEPVSATSPAAAAYWVQVGAFRDAASAGRLVARLQEPNLVLSPGLDALLRVRLGPFADRAEAEAKRLELQTKGYPAFIARSAD